MAEIYFFELLSTESKNRAVHDFREAFKCEMGFYPKWDISEGMNGFFYADGKKYE